MPNGVSTGLDIGLSNFSLSLITLSFYTMCKSTTPIFLLCFCFLWGIEKWALRHPHLPRTPMPSAFSLCTHLGRWSQGRRPSRSMRQVCAIWQVHVT